MAVGVVVAGAVVVRVLWCGGVVAVVLWRWVLCGGGGAMAVGVVVVRVLWRWVLWW
ncbi:hypothetical protein MNL02_06745 [Bartonella krasnovii]|uniref:hypothetical protein n=1 Tax=Bartonella krasnovii TaxID=2267275 RepID=UPI001F4D0AF3|nr:hypothetical protein [Bartonella krasnovii]UNF51750.1 hypothetical protein MNL02_06745 [Bartonella krasnovii]